MNDSENQVIKERFNELKERLESINNQDINLNEAGIKELNNRISSLVEMENDVKSLVKVSTEKYNDQELLEYTSLMSEINEYITKLNTISDKLKNAQRAREKLRNKLTDENHALNDKRAEFDYKISDANEKIEIEKQVLELDLSDVDRNYHESLLNINEKYVEDLIQERKPFDEKYDSYSKEIDALINGGDLNFQLDENGDLKEKEVPEIKEIEVLKENVNLADTYEENDAQEGFTAETIENVVPEIKEVTINASNEEFVPTVETELVDDKAFHEETPVEEEVLNPLNEEFVPAVETELVDDKVSHEETPVEEVLNPLNEELVPSAEPELLDDEDYENNNDEVIGVKDASQYLLEESVNLINGANRYMNSVKTVAPVEEVKEEKDNLEAKRYQLREGEILTAEVADENGDSNKIEIDFDGNKRIINSNGEVSTGRAVLDEVVEDDEKIMEVGPEDLELNFELPDLSMLTEPSENVEDEGISLKRTA